MEICTTSQFRSMLSVLEIDVACRPSTLPSMDEQSDIFNALSWPPDSVALSLESAHVPAPSQVTPSTNTTAELPSLLTLLLPMMNGVETASMPSAPVSCQPKQAAIVFSSNNGVIDDPLIQSLAAEQAASAHNYDLLSHRHKRVSHRSSNSRAFAHAVE